MLKEEGQTTAEAAIASEADEEGVTQDGEVKTDETKGEVSESADAKAATAVTDKQGDTVVPDAPTNGATSTLPGGHGLPGSAPGLPGGLPDSHADSQSSMPYHQQDETGWLHVRAIISSAEAATVIGKGGENVTQIRRMAGAKCTVSEYSRGAVERILTVSGLVDAVAKVR